MTSALCKSCPSARTLNDGTIGCYQGYCYQLEDEEDENFKEGYCPICNHSYRFITPAVSATCPKCNQPLTLKRKFLFAHLGV